MAEQNFRLWNLVSLNNFRRFSPAVKTHLTSVYISLIDIALVASAFGVGFDMLLNIGGFFTSLGVLGCMVWLSYTHTNQQSENRRLVLFLSAFLKGVSIGPLIKLAIYLDSSIFITAFVGTSVLFTCLSTAAIFTRRRAFFIVRGRLTSMLYTFGPLLVMSLINRGHGRFLEFELLYGLVVFMGYIVVDTQEMVEKAHQGYRDYAEHSFTCFTNFVDVFVRILIILMLWKSAHKLQEHSTVFLERILCQVTKTAMHLMLVARARRVA